jgi:eukaryotic-like serine/threonine-protein kinase
VTWLSDAALDRLREGAEWPDLSGTRYEALGVLGRGGMSTVFRARDRELDREVALKVMAPEGEGTVARLRTEARVLARLEHPGLVPVHDMGTLPDGRVFYVMRLVRGKRLDEHARRERSLSALLRLFERVCEAVAFAHAKGVLHRDLKPANVMVGPFGEVLVLDWGLAKEVGTAEHASEPRPPAPPSDSSALAALADAPTPTQRGTVLGTPGFMPPEQARGEVDRVDERADVYALGAMLRFLLETREGEAPRALTAIAAKATAAHPPERYASVAALAEDVARFLSADRVGAYRERLGERMGRLVSKHRVPIALVGAYLLMRVLLAVFARV